MSVLCAVIGSIYACIFPFHRCMLRCIRKESYKILNLGSLGYLKILRSRRVFSVVSNIRQPGCTHRLITKQALPLN